MRAARAHRSAPAATGTPATMRRMDALRGGALLQRLQAGRVVAAHVRKREQHSVRTHRHEKIDAAEHADGPRRHHRVVEQRVARVRRATPQPLPRRAHHAEAQAKLDEARAEAELSRRRGPRATVESVLKERRGRQEGFLAGLAERRKEALAKLLR